MVLYQMIIKPSSSKKWNTLFPHQEVHPLKSDPLPRVLQQAERTSHRICKVNKRLTGDTVLPLKVDCPGGVPQTTLSSSVFLSHAFSPARTAQTLFVEVTNEPEGCPAEPRKINQVEDSGGCRVTVTLTFLSRLSVAQQPCRAIPKISIMGRVRQITEHNRISFYNCHGFFPTCSLVSLFLLHCIYCYYFAYKKGKVSEIRLCCGFFSFAQQLLLVFPLFSSIS